MRAYVYLLLAVTWISLGATSIGAQFGKDTGLFGPKKDAPVVMKIDDKRTLYMVSEGSEEWIFCVMTTEFGESLDAVVLMKTERTEYAERCPIMLVLSRGTEEDNSINLSIGLGDFQQTTKIPILYLSKDDHFRKWIKREYKKKVLNTKQEETVSFQ